MENFLHQFLHLLGDALPVLTLAVVLAGLIEALLRFQAFDRWLTALARRPVMMLAAGAVLPGCALSSLPLAVVLRRSGAPAGSVAGFMLMAAILGPSGVLMTAFFLGWEMLLMRVVWPFVVLMPFVLVLGRLPSPAFEDKAVRAEGCGCGKEKDSVESGKSFFGAWVGAILDMARMLLPLIGVGLLITAILRTLFPEAELGERFGEGWPAYLVAALVGLPLYVCEGAEAAIGWMLLEVGVAPGVVFTFVLASAGTCLPTLFSAARLIGVAYTMAAAVYWWIMSIAGGLLFAFLFGGGS